MPVGHAGPGWGFRGTWTWAQTEATLGNGATQGNTAQTLEGRYVNVPSKGSEPAVVTKLASGNEMAASVKEISFFFFSFFPESKHKCA